MDIPNDLSEHLCQLAKVTLEAIGDTLGDDISAVLVFMPSQGALDLHPGERAPCGVATTATQAHTQAMLATLYESHGIGTKPLIVLPEHMIQ